MHVFHTLYIIVRIFVVVLIDHIDICTFVFAMYSFDCRLAIGMARKKNPRKKQSPNQSQSPSQTHIPLPTESNTKPIQRTRGQPRKKTNTQLQHARKQRHAKDKKKSISESEFTEIKNSNVPIV